MGKLKITSSYGIVPNAILNNKELSLRAKGVFAFLQGKPDGWNFSIVRISAQTRDGKHSVRESLKELEVNGYLQRLPIRDKNGFKGYDYVLSEFQSSENQTSENQSSEDQSSENYDTLSKKEYSKKDIVRNNIDTAEQSSAQAKKSKKKDKIPIDTPMDLSQFIKWTRKSPQKHIVWIGEWADTIYKYENLRPAINNETVGQWQEFIGRHASKAVILTKKYSDDQIAAGFTAAMKASKDGEQFKVTPETIIKYLT